MRTRAHAPSPKMLHARLALKYLCLLCLLWLKSVLLHDGLALWRADEVGEGTCGLLFVRALQDGETLIEGLVQIFRYQRPATVALDAHRQRHDRDFNIARLRILKRLPDVVAVNELRLHSLPNACALQCLFCGKTVRRVIGIRDRDALYFRPRE